MSQIPEVRLEGGGVMYRYLRFALEVAGEKRRIVRGLNYLPYAPDLDGQIVKMAREELEEQSFFDSGGNLVVEGGGSLAFNGYYETITLFGVSQAHGSEEARDGTAEVIERIYPDCEVSWFDAETESKTSSPES